MADSWTEGRWGDLVTLEYGRPLRNYKQLSGRFRVYGTNGPIGWHDEFLCPQPTVVVGRKGAYRGIHYSAEPCSVIDTAFYLRPRTDIDLRWAYYQLLTQDINGMDSGSAIPSTSRTAFYELPVTIPPLPAQRTIGEILGTIDERIALSQRMNQTLEAIAWALFQSWFIDFDPVEAKEIKPTLPTDLADLFPDRLVDSELGPIPDGWDARGLDEIATLVNGLALQKYPPTTEQSLPIIKISQLRSGKLQGADLASAELDPKYVVHDGDILFSWSGSLECRMWTGGKGALNQHLFKVVPNRTPKWLCYLAIHRHLSDFRSIAAGKATTMGHIQRHHLSNAKQAVPPREILQHLNTVIEPILERKVESAIEARDLATLRDALLPRLISGRLQVVH